MKYEKVLESNNILYVKANISLIEDYLKMLNNPNVQKFINHETVEYTYDGEVKWINSKLENNAPFFSMIRKDNNNFIGNIEIMNIIDNVGELGICITPMEQDKHFGCEAVKTIVEYGLKTLKLDKIILKVYKINPRAFHCYEKVGFKVIEEREEEYVMQYFEK